MNKKTRVILSIIFIITQIGCSKSETKVEKNISKNEQKQNTEIDTFKIEDFPEIDEALLKPKPIPQLSRDRRLAVRVTDNGEVEEYERLFNGRYKIESTYDDESGGYVRILDTKNNGDIVWEWDSQMENSDYSVGTDTIMSIEDEHLIMLGWKRDVGRGLLFFNKEAQIEKFLHEAELGGYILPFNGFKVSKNGEYIIIPLKVAKNNDYFDSYITIISMKRNGEILWKYTPQIGTFSKVLISPDGNTVLICVQERIGKTIWYCYDNQKFKLKWSFEMTLLKTSAEIFSSPMHIADKGQFIITYVQFSKIEKALLFFDGSNGDKIGALHLSKEKNLENIYLDILSPNSNYFAYENRLYNLSYILEKCKRNTK